jgi:predicted nuclease of predicted toxin-antitoxin system
MAQESRKGQPRFLADENIPILAVQSLKKKGVEVIALTELSKAGLNDETVLHLAHDENRILVTFDKDFGEHVFKSKQATSGVLLLRFIPESINELVNSLSNVISLGIELENHFTVVDKKRIRSIPIS